MDGMSRRPNIVFILVDDLVWTDIGAYGSSFYETPNVDLVAGRDARAIQVSPKPEVQQNDVP